MTLCVRSASQISTIQGFTRERRKAESGEKMEKNIRKAAKNDAGRLAEIIVFNNRKNYYPIFRDIVYSFSEYTVANVTEQFLRDSEFMEHCYVYEDQVIKGFLCVADREIKKLYVDTFFQGEGIGTALLRYGVEELNADNLWALEKNENALHFYRKLGFRCTNEKIYEEGTTEYLIHLVR